MVIGLTDDFPRSLVNMMLRPQIARLMAISIGVEIEDRLYSIIRLSDTD